MKWNCDIFFAGAIRSSLDLRIRLHLQHGWRVHIRMLCFLTIGLFGCGDWVIYVAAKPAPNVLVINPNLRFQVIDNFGANDAWYLQQLSAWSDSSKERVADLLFSTNRGIGLSCWRFYLGAGQNQVTIQDRSRSSESFEVKAGEYDWNRQTGQRWFLRAAKERGVRQFLATIYSPPLRLTQNGLSNLGTNRIATTNLKPGAETDFARYASDILKHFRDNPDERERVEFDYVLPVNEPQWEWQRGQEGNRASNDDLRRIYREFGVALQAARLRTKILGPESGSIPGMYGLESDATQQWRADYGDYLRFISGDTNVSAGFGKVFSYHSYWSDREPDQLVPHRQQLAAAMKNYPDWKLWQSEYCVMEPRRDLGMDTALRVARIIHADLTVANASAWQWWLALAGEDYKSGLIYTDYHRPGDPESILESKTLWALGNFSRFIRPGMQRVDLRHASQSTDAISASAYLDDATGRIVLVLINPHVRRVMQRVIFEKVSDSPVRSARFLRYTTSASKNLVADRPVNVGTDFTLDPRSITTLVSE